MILTSLTSFSYAFWQPWMILTRSARLPHVIAYAGTPPNVSETSVKPVLPVFSDGFDQVWSNQTSLTSFFQYVLNNWCWFWPVWPVFLYVLTYAATSNASFWIVCLKWIQFNSYEPTACSGNSCFSLSLTMIDWHCSLHEKKRWRLLWTP